MPYALYIDNEKVFVHPNRDDCLYYAGHCLVTGPARNIRLFKDGKPFYTVEDTTKEAKRIHPAFKKGRL